MSEEIKLTGLGIEGLKIPITIPIADGSSQTTVATVNVFAIPPLGFTGPDIGNFTDTLHRVASDLEVDRRISWYSIKSDTMGSIHNDDSCVFLEKDKWYLFPIPEMIYER